MVPKEGERWQHKVFQRKCKSELGHCRDSAELRAQIRLQCYEMLTVVLILQQSSKALNLNRDPVTLVVAQTQGDKIPTS